MIGFGNGYIFECLHPQKLVGKSPFFNFEIGVWGTCRKTNISPRKFMLLKSPRRKWVVVGFRHFTCLSYWGFFSKGKNGTTIKFSPLFPMEISECCLGELFFPQSYLPQGVMRSQVTG
jgi:hypothetical protein